MKTLPTILSQKWRYGEHCRFILPTHRSPTTPILLSLATPFSHPPPLQPRLPRRQRPIQHRRLMPPRHIPISRQILIQPRQDLRTSRGIPPIPHQIHHNGKHTLQDDSRPLHPRICIPGKLTGKRPAGLGVSEDSVSLSTKAQRKKLSADVRGDAREDDLGFVRRLDGSAEVGIVPGVDFAVAADERGVRVHARDFFGEKTVRPGFGAGGENDWNIE